MPVGLRLEDSDVLGAGGDYGHAEFFLDLADEGVDVALARFSLAAREVGDVLAS